MGKHFGNLQYLKGVTYYVLSPTELKPFAGILSNFKFIGRRISDNIIPFGVPTVMSCLIFNYFITDYHKSQCKNPDDYKDDE